MIKKIRFLTYRLFLPVLIITAIAAKPDGGGRYIDPHIMLDDIFKSIDNAKTLTYNMVYSERLADGTMHTDSNFVKLQLNPKKIFVLMSDKTAVLWVANTNKNNAYVHSGSLHVTMSLDPDGSLMRKNQHHSVVSTGDSYFEDILKQAAKTSGPDFESHFLFLGETIYNGVKCYNMQVIVPDFKYVPYTVLKGENVLTIANKLGLSEYMIMLHNNLPSFESVTTGEVIQVPNTYAKQMALYIDETTYLPVLIKDEDDKGLFEQYIFRNVKVNAPLTDEDFSKKNL